MLWSTLEAPWAEDIGKAVADSRKTVAGGVSSTDRPKVVTAASLARLHAGITPESFDTL